MKPAQVASSCVLIAVLAVAAGRMSAEPATAAQVPTAEPSPLVPPAPEPPPPSAWKFTGDFRARYERTTLQQPTGDALVLDPRHREVVRFRAGVSRSFGPALSFGARLTTGSAEDPNSTDITIGDFDDRLEVNLDRAYLELHQKGLMLTAGKFVNPFVATELVWDGDVHPQGFAASLGAQGSGRVKPKLVGLFFFVDEQTVAPDSYMLGGQGQLALRASSAWSAVAGLGYYDYTIKSLRNADSGDTRTNRLAPGGLAYLSDYNLLDGVVTLDHRGFGKRYPVKLVADFVKNVEADDQNQGFAVDLLVGRAAEKGDWRFRYGYSQAETDAVLAAFSHDNTTLATNYRQHTAQVDFQVRKECQLNLTWYLYQKLEAGAASSNPWTTRVRVNALLAF